MNDSRSNHTVQKAIEILKLVAFAKDGLSLADITRQLSYVKSTVFTIVHTLEDARMLEYENGRYHLGSMSCTIGMQYLGNCRLLEMAKPILSTLRDELDQTVFMAVQDGLSMVYVLKLESHSYIQPTANLGTITPMIPTGLGKAALACMEDEEIVRQITEEMYRESNTPEITDEKSLLCYLEKVRKRGYVLDCGFDHGIQVQSVALPIRDAFGNYRCSISVVNVKTGQDFIRMTDMVDKALAAALEISHRMGYSGDRLF